MKNTRAMLAPVNTRKIEAIDRPMTAQKAQKVICAVLADMDWMRKREEEDERQRRQHHHPLQRASRRSARRAPGVLPTT